MTAKQRVNTNKYTSKQRGERYNDRRIQVQGTIVSGTFLCHGGYNQYPQLLMYIHH